MEAKIKKILSEITSISVDQITLETPENLAFGDYTTNLALKSQDDKTNPRQRADDFVTKFKDSKDLMEIIEKIEVAGPGFINFYLKKEILIDTLLDISSYKDTFGYSKEKEGKKVIVEYSSANIAKPFTIGHLRSTIIGDSIAKLLEAVGYEVYRDNHLGDWGTQFGKQILAIKKWGDISDIEKSDNPVKELVGLYVRFHKEAENDPSLDDEARVWFKKLEKGDNEARNLWQKCVVLSLKEFEKIYKKLGVSFSREFNNGKGLGESFFEDKMMTVIEDLKEKQLLKPGEHGAQLVFFEDEKYPPAMIIKKDGTSLYHTRDLATDKYRKDNYNPDLIINEVGLEQSLYFQQLFEIERLLGWFNKDQRVHIGHGLYRFKDKKMSTRKGDVIWLEEVLDQAVVKAKSLGANKGKSGIERPRVLNPKAAENVGFGKQRSAKEFEDEQEITANMVGIGALKYNDLKRDPRGDIVFDWDDILNMDGNSGPYLQYTYARCQSVLSKSTFKGQDLQGNSSTAQQFNSEENSLLRTFIHFPKVITEAAVKYSPNILCTYLYDLAQKYNSFYNAHKIIGSKEEGFRVKITEATGIVLKNGLNLLGIKAPEKM